MSRHRLANPSCPFVQNQSNNVPLGNSADSSRVETATDDVNAENDVEMGGRGGGEDNGGEGGRIGGGVESHEDTDDAGYDGRALLNISGKSSVILIYLKPMAYNSHNVNH